MPRGDGTGPIGMGRMTGCGAGFCAGFATPGYVSAKDTNPISFRYGLSRGGGYHRMFYGTGLPRWERHGYSAYSDINDTDEKEYLSRQAEYLEKQLQQIEKRLSSLAE